MTKMCVKLYYAMTCHIEKRNRFNCMINIERKCSTQHGKPLNQFKKNLFIFLSAIL